MLSNSRNQAVVGDLDIIAFRLRGQEFCVETTKVREIRGWVACTPVPYAPPDVLGVINLRGEVVPIIDLARRLGMEMTSGTDRSAIVVAEVGDAIVGLLVDSVSDILTVSSSKIQSVPDVVVAGSRARSTRGMLTHEQGMICLLDLPQLLGGGDGNQDGAVDHARPSVATRH